MNALFMDDYEEGVQELVEIVYVDWQYYSKDLKYTGKTSEEKCNWPALTHLLFGLLCIQLALPFEYVFDGGSLEIKILYINFVTSNAW